MHRLLILVVIVLTIALPLSARPPAAAAELHEISVIRDAESGQPRFEPPVLYVAPGDTVRINMGGKVFASRLIAGMHPPGADLWWGQVGESVEVTLAEPGVYGHKCGASYALGLVGLIVVGDPSVNLDAARTVPHPPVAARVFDELFASLSANRPG
jgi:pseudoazurin